jgi:hypothetical protein
MEARTHIFVPPRYRIFQLKILEKARVWKKRMKYEGSY